jgi:phage N-6-adenine-methyltransferase
MPKQKPGKSEQTVQTPPAFVAAVQARFGRIGFDLAATAENSVAGALAFFGPRSLDGEDAFTQEWPRGKLCWLNPPFGNVRPFATKAAAEAKRGIRTAMLVPASVGSNWFAEHVHGKAMVLALRPRLTFVGQEDPYPKDLILCLYGPWYPAGFATWQWNNETEVAAP